MNKYYLSVVTLIFICVLPGCANFQYYIDAMGGHSDLLERREPIDDVLAQTNLDPNIHKKLSNLKQARRFASEVLHLPDNGSYTEYSDLERDHVVWNVVAAPVLSTKPKEWCFLFVGCLTYRGYFDKEKAQQHAAELQQQGYETYIGGVSAYSTLGWFDDPILNTMLSEKEFERVGVLFHELAHQLVYRKNNTEFNESFATYVEEEGVRRWFKSQNREEMLNDFYIFKEHEDQFYRLLLQTKNELEIIYTTHLTDAEKLAKKQQAFKDLKQRYKEIRKTWGDYSLYDKWMEQDLTNAHFVLVQTYNGLVPVFAKMLEKYKGDLAAFYEEVERIGHLSDDDFEKEIQKYQIMLTKN